MEDPMPIERWTPPIELSRREQMLIKRLDRVRKLLGFLRLHRRELFSDEFQAELEGMYRDNGAGKEPVAPALMAMATFIQAYLDVSDAEMVELTVVDLRVQMVLDCLGADQPAFSQGALCDFRNRLIRTDMDRRLLERTVELARKTGGFDWRKLPRSLRVAVDCSPFDGAGRVEDTFHLLGHAARKRGRCVAGPHRRGRCDAGQSPRTDCDARPTGRPRAPADRGRGAVHRPRLRRERLHRACHRQRW